MARNIKTLIVFVVILAVCLSGYGAYLLYDHYADGKTAKEQEKDAIHIFKLNGEIIKLTINNKESKNSYTYSGEYDKWTWDEDTELPLRTFHLSAISSSLKKLTAQRSFTATEDLSAYGYNKPSYELIVSDDNGASQHLLFGKSFGDETAVYYYLMEKDGSIIYTVEDTILTSLDNNVFDMVAFDSVPQITESEVRIIKLTMDGKTTTFRQDVTASPGDSEENQETVYTMYVSNNGKLTKVDDLDIGSDGTSAYDLFKKLLDAVYDLSFYSCADWKIDSSAMTAYGFDNPYMTISVKYVESDSGEERSFTLTIGGPNESGEFNYAVLDDSKMVCLSKSTYVSNVERPASSLIGLIA